MLFAAHFFEVFVGKREKRGAVPDRRNFGLPTNESTLDKIEPAECERFIAELNNPNQNIHD